MKLSTHLTSGKTSWQVLGVAAGIVLGLSTNPHLRPLIVSAYRWHSAGPQLDLALAPGRSTSPNARQELSARLQSLISNKTADPAVAAAAAPAAFAASSGALEDRVVQSIPEASLCWSTMEESSRAHIARVIPLQTVFHSHRNSPVVAAALTRAIVCAVSDFKRADAAFVNGVYPRPEDKYHSEAKSEARLGPLNRALQLRLLAVTAAGEALEPGNAYWPLCAALGHMGLRDDRSMIAAMDRAHRCTHFNEHSSELLSGACTLYGLLNPGRTTSAEMLKVIDNQPSTVVYYLSLLWTECAWKSVLLEHQGNNDAGFAIRLRLAKTAALVASNAASLDCRLVSDSLVLNSMVAIGGNTAGIATGQQPDVTRAQSYSAAVNHLDALGEKQTADWFRFAGGKALRHHEWFSRGANVYDLDLRGVNTSIFYCATLWIAGGLFVVAVLAATATLARARTRFMVAEPPPCLAEAKLGANAAIWCMVLALGAIYSHVSRVSLVACIITAIITGSALVVSKRNVRRPAGLGHGYWETAGWAFYTVLLALIGTWQLGVLFSPDGESSMFASAGTTMLQAHFAAAATQLPFACLFWYLTFVMQRIKYISPNVAVYRLAKIGAIPALTLILLCFALLSWKTASYEAGFRATMNKVTAINLPAE